MLKKTNIRNILILLLAGAFLVSVFNIAKTGYNYKVADKVNLELREQFVAVVENAPEIEEKAQIPISVDFETLKQENDDIVGWIYSPDTPINYPIVQGDDNEQYLRADLNGKYLFSGTIFVDYRNGNIGEDKNYIIYGHNIKNSTMFGTLVDYKDQAYYDAHPVIYLLTPEANYVIELFAGAIVKDNDNIYQTYPSSSAISNIVANSSFISDVSIKDEDKIITLSTCSYEFNNARYILLGKLTEI